MPNFSGHFHVIAVKILKEQSNIMGKCLDSEWIAERTDGDGSSTVRSVGNCPEELGGEFASVIEDKSRGFREF
jgi:hypothetical protein